MEKCFSVLFLNEPLSFLSLYISFDYFYIVITSMFCIVCFVKLVRLDFFCSQSLSDTLQFLIHISLFYYIYSQSKYEIICMQISFVLPYWENIYLAYFEEEKLVLYFFLKYRISNIKTLKICFHWSYISYDYKQWIVKWLYPWADFHISKYKRFISSEIVSIWIWLKPRI